LRENGNIRKQDFELDESLVVHAPLEESKSEEIAYHPKGFWIESLQRLKKNRGAVIGFIVIIIISLLAIFGPMMNKYDYNTQDLTRSNLPPLVEGLERVGFDGTDSHGKNIY